MENPKSKKQLKTTLPKYVSNPSFNDVVLNTKTRKVFASNNEALYITNAVTGEQTPATGGATFIKEDIVDNAQFIKLYAEGVKHLANLNGAGFKMFQIVYQLMLDNPNNDKLIIDYNDLLHRNIFTQSQKTFIRGINELLEKGILYQSVTANVYFLNLNLFFNGDRINIVKSYKRKTPSKSLPNENQLELNLA